MGIGYVGGCRIIFNESLIKELQDRFDTIYSPLDKASRMRKV